MADLSMQHTIAKILFGIDDCSVHPSNAGIWAQQYNKFVFCRKTAAVAADLAHVDAHSFAAALL